MSKCRHVKQRSNVLYIIAMLSFYYLDSISRFCVCVTYFEPKHSKSTDDGIKWYKKSKTGDRTVTVVEYYVDFGKLKIQFPLRSAAAATANIHHRMVWVADLDVTALTHPPAHPYPFTYSLETLFKQQQQYQHSSTTFTELTLLYFFIYTIFNICFLVYLCFVIILAFCPRLCSSRRSHHCRFIHPRANVVYCIKASFDDDATCE